MYGRRQPGGHDDHGAISRRGIYGADKEGGDQYKINVGLDGMTNNPHHK